MKACLVSEHESPVAVLGGEDTGSQHVHVAASVRGPADTAEIGRGVDGCHAAFPLAAG